MGDEVAIAAILRNKREYCSWQWCKAHRPRHARADVDPEIHVVNAVDVPLLENGLVDVGALLLRELHAASRSFLGAGLRPGAALGSLLLGFSLRTTLGSLLLGFSSRTTLGSLLLGFSSRTTLGSLLLGFSSRTTLGSPLLGLSLCTTLAVFLGVRLRTLRAVLARLRPIAALCQLLRLRPALGSLLLGL